MTSTKRVETKVTARDLAEAQSGVYLSPISPRPTVECPESYDADEITAETCKHPGCDQPHHDRAGLTIATGDESDPNAWDLAYHREFEEGPCDYCGRN